MIFVVPDNMKTNIFAQQLKNLHTMDHFLESRNCEKRTLKRVIERVFEEKPIPFNESLEKLGEDFLMGGYLDHSPKPIFRMVD